MYYKSSPRSLIKLLLAYRITVTRGSLNFLIAVFACKQMCFCFTGLRIMKWHRLFQHLYCASKQFARDLTTTSRLCRRKVISKQPRLSEEELSKKFIDERRISLVAGNGGNGRSHFLRDKLTAFGGPSGGDGGKGADIYFVANRNVKSLAKLKSFYNAENAKSGGSHDLHGKDGEDLYVNVPVGTLVRSDETDDIIADLAKHDQIQLMCSGGEGGKGNRFFVSSVNTTPVECTPGLPGEQMVVWLEMRTLAHGGLIGFPNAGKSTLLRTLTNARPAVADYEFTTLVPHLGVLHFEDFAQIIIADTPGIIEGAHMNEGLGIRFLKHIERCRFLLFVIDMSTTCPFNQLYQLVFELEQYDKSLVERPGLVLANKMDLRNSFENFSQFQDDVEQLNLPYEILPVSGKKGQYIEDVILKIRELYDHDISERKRYGKTIALEW